MGIYPIYGFGVIIPGDEIDEFIEQQGIECDDVYDFLEKCEDKKHIVRYYNDETSGRYYATPGKGASEYEDMLVIWSDKQPSAFEKAYEDMQEVAAEMMSEFSFPDDINWYDYVGYFHCCVCC